MHADCAYTIGSAHRVCQDYARARITASGEPYAIVSDGCSGSPDTDIGARLLTVAAERVLNVGLGVTAPLLTGMVSWPAVPPQETSRRSVDLDRPHALDATLLVATLDDAHHPYAAIWGDGAAAYRAASGELRGVRLLAPAGAPLYVAYNWSTRRYASYREAAGEAPRRVVGLGINRGVGLDVSAVIPAPPYILPAPGAKVMAVFSDGVESFHDTAGVQVDPDDVIEELMAFKSLTGEFVKRRFYAFLRSAAARGWAHHDDLAMAAIYCGEPAA